MNTFKSRLYKQYSPAVFRFILSKIDRYEDAEEILQDTWMSIFDSLPLFNHKSSFLTWAFAIAKHEVADFYRKKKIKSFVFSKLPFLEHLVSEAFGPELLFEKKELKKDLEQVMKNLSEGYQEILRLKYIDNCSMVTFAKLLKTTTKAVESKLFRARLAFQKEWQISYQNASYTSLPFLLLKSPI